MTESQLERLINQINQMKNEIITKLEEIRCCVIDAETEIETIKKKILGIMDL